MPDSVPHHRLRIRRQLGSLSLDVSLALTSDWTLLFGPSGSGKSTLLRAACGLVEGGVTFERLQPDDAWKTLASASPHLRNLSWAPQRASLMPHLTVLENVAFAVDAAGDLHSGSKRLATDAIELFRLAPLAHRLPRDLSGGERQRVNLARAFAAPGCRLMLLDEPFAGIDRNLRDELLPKMRSWLGQRGIPVLSVSHDVEEALQLQAHVVLIRDGKVESEGPAATALSTERARMLQTLTAQIA